MKLISAFLKRLCMSNLQQIPFEIAGRGETKCSCMSIVFINLYDQSWKMFWENDTTDAIG